MAKKHIWQKPKLRDDEEQQKERRASWLQVFYDLIFVAVIANLAHTLAEEKDLSGDAVLKFGLLFIPMWWVWIGSTFYNERFETDDVSHRLFTFLKMLALVAMAYSTSAGDAFKNMSVPFALSYAAARIILTVMWVRAGLHSPPARPLVARYAVGFSISILLWLASIWVDPPFRFVLWGLGLLIDLLTPLTTMSIEARLPRLSTSHLPERLGLLIIIVLGESVVGVIHGVAHSHHLTASTAALAILGLAICFALWWVYFDHIMSRRAKASIWWILAWVYTHLVLAVGITAFSAAVRNAIGHDGEMLSDSVRWLLCGSFTVVLVALAILEWTLVPPSGSDSFARQMALLRAAGAIAAVLLGWLGGALSSVALFGGMLVVGLVQVVHGLYGQSLGHFGSPHGAEGEHAG